MLYFYFVTRFISINYLSKTFLYMRPIKLYGNSYNISTDIIRIMRYDRMNV